MPRGIGKNSDAADPVAAWLAAPAPELPTEAPVALEVSPELPTPVGGEAVWYCPQRHQCGPAAKFCPECGAARAVLPVSGAGVAVELAARPVPGDMLTPAQRAERERAHAAAVRAGTELPSLTYQPPRTTETVLIHIAEDGLTAFGQVWYRGQELELDVGSERWRQAQRWINMTEEQQYERYGKVMFRPGPWPGRKSYTEGAGGFQRLSPVGAGGQVAGPSIEQLRQADEAEARRRRGVPAPAFR